MLLPAKKRPGKGAFPMTTNAGIQDKTLQEWKRQFQARPENTRLQNAVTRESLDSIGLNRAILTDMDESFSIHLDDWEVTNQKKSGRCWMFAAMNLFRVDAMQKMQLEKFEFSQCYPQFWDKLERSNYFLENILTTRSMDLDSREVAFLLEDPIADGGQWNMFINIVKKYGLVPQTVMPETESSSNTVRMNAILRAKLREGARILREMHQQGQEQEDLRAAKKDLLQVIYRILSIHLGTPPEEFTWQWRDKNKEFRRDGRFTPLGFAEKYVTAPLDDYVCLVHDPRPDHPYGQTYTVQYLGNVVGGDPVLYLNVEMAEMKKAALQTLQSGEPVWFGCDVGKMAQRKEGYWDARLFDYEGIYNTEFGLTKAERLQYHESSMTHAMLFTGVDVVDDAPRRWRVENSWGKDAGKKGFYIMNDSWFDDYMFEVAVRKEFLPEPLQEALKKKPQVLAPWDPMGSLAR